MKRIILIKILITMMFFIGQVYAIDFTIGAYAGINTGSFSGSDYDDYIDTLDTYYGNASSKAVSGFSVATFFEIAFSDIFSVQPEIQYTVQRGGIGAEKNNGDTVDITDTINTIVIPFLCKFKIPLDKNKMYISIGPNILLIIGNIKSKTTFNLNDKISSSTSNYRPDNPVNLGFTIALGHEIPIDTGKIIIDLRYSKSITDYINKNDTRTNILGLNLGYGFNL